PDVGGHHLVAQVAGGRAPALIVALFAGQPIADVLDVAARLVESRPRLETGDDFEIPRGTRARVLDRRLRDPQLRAFREHEFGRQHRDDGVRNAVDRDRAADHRWIARVAALPDAVA